MKKLLIALCSLSCLVLLAPAFAPRGAVAEAQQCSSYTLVTATVTDPNSVPWAGANLSIDLNPPGVNSPTCTGTDGLQHPFSAHFSTTLDSTGSFVVQLPPNSIITPGSTKWTFSLSISVPPPVGRGNQAISSSFTISGGSQSLSASLSALSTALLYGGGGAANPCTITPFSVQIDNSGAFGCAGATDNAGLLNVTDNLNVQGYPFNDIPALTSVDGGGAIVENSNFEEAAVTGVTTPAIPGWIGNAGALSLDTATPYEGLNSLKVTQTTISYNSALTTNCFIPVQADTYQIYAAMHGDGTLIPTANIRFTNDTGSNLGDITATGAAGTSWVTYSATGTPAAGATNACVELLASASGTAGYTEYDVVRVRDLSAAGNGVVNSTLIHTPVVGAGPGSSTTVGPSANCTPPSTNGQFAIEYVITGAAAADPSCPQVGLGTESDTGTPSRTIAYSDNAQVITLDYAATQNQAVTLPTATTLGNSQFAFSYCNHSPTYTVTITPTTWTIQADNNAAGSSLTINPGKCDRITVDAHTATQWHADTSNASGGGTGDYTYGGGVVSGCGGTGSAYLPFPLGGGCAAASPSAANSAPIATGGTITAFYVGLSTAPGAGSTVTLTVYDSTTAEPLTCSITGASATTCSDTTHSFTASQGDLLTVKWVQSGSTAASAGVVFSLRVTGAN